MSYLNDLKAHVVIKILFTYNYYAIEVKLLLISPLCFGRLIEILIIYEKSNLFDFNRLPN